MTMKSGGFDIALASVFAGVPTGVGLPPIVIWAGVVMATLIGLARLYYIGQGIRIRRRELKDD